MLYDDELTRYGKSANGLSRLNVTVCVSVALVPPGERMPASAARAPEPLLGLSTRSMLATTSAASKGVPSLNVTPWRSVKVQTSPFWLGVQDSGELRLEGVGVAEVDQVLGDLVDEDDAALVVDRDRVEGLERRRDDCLHGAAR